MYPETRFILAHIVGDSVTFYQASAGAPTTDAPPEGDTYDKVWCEHCHLQQPYRRREGPDPEFPNAAWGDWSTPPTARATRSSCLPRATATAGASPPWCACS